MKGLIWASVGCLLIAMGWTKLVGGGTGFEPEAPGEASTVEAWPRIDQAQYAGSARCAECHKSHYDGWKDSRTTR